jgi:hypothetical protein
MLPGSQSTFTRFTGHPDLGKFDLSSVRYYSGSSPVGGNDVGMSNLRANKTFKGQFFCAYASSEAGGRITYLLPNDIDAAYAPGGRREIVESVGRAARLGRRGRRRARQRAAAILPRSHGAWALADYSPGRRLRGAPVRGEVLLL